DPIRSKRHCRRGCNDRRADVGPDADRVRAGPTRGAQRAETGSRRPPGLAGARCVSVVGAL
ncbi:MAG: hypothetical protein AVDCRST_MAG71-2402, partial [uncultured Lysobacter sp.]